MVIAHFFQRKESHKKKRQRNRDCPDKVRHICRNRSKHNCRKESLSYTSKEMYGKKIEEKIAEAYYDCIKKFQSPVKPTFGLHQNCHKGIIRWWIRIYVLIGTYIIELVKCVVRLKYCFLLPYIAYAGCVRPGIVIFQMWIRKSALKIDEKHA